MSAQGWSAGDYQDRPLRDLLDDVAGTDPVPAAGSACAVTIAMAAGLVAKAAQRSASQLDGAAAIAARADMLRERLASLAVTDAENYARFTAQGRPEGDSTADLSLQVPQIIAESGVKVAEMAEQLTTSGNPSLRHDTAAAADLAATAARISASLVRANGAPEEIAHAVAATADKAERFALEASRAAAESRSPRG